MVVKKYYGHNRPIIIAKQYKSFHFEKNYQPSVRFDIVDISESETCNSY